MEWNSLQRNKDVHVKSKSLGTQCKNHKNSTTISIETHTKIEVGHGHNPKTMNHRVSEGNINAFVTLRKAKFSWT